MTNKRSKGVFVHVLVWDGFIAFVIVFLGPPRNPEFRGAGARAATQAKPARRRARPTNVALLQSRPRSYLDRPARLPDFGVRCRLCEDE